MKEIILIKDGEIALKGLNRRNFEDALIKNIRWRIAPLGSFEIRSAQSTIFVRPLSEDIDLVSEAFRRFDLGKLDTVAGAAGGARFRPIVSRERAARTLAQLAERLGEPGRMLPGGFLYTSDVTSEPDTAQMIGEILAMQYYDRQPDLVLTMETKGIPAALMAAQALGVPLVIARRSSKVYEGSAVNINYVSGSSAHIETMSLSRRAVREGQRALIVDDFLKAGGTARGMIELMGEFNVEVVGMAFVMAKAQPASKLIQGERALMVMDLEGDDPSTLAIRPADWV